MQYTSARIEHARQRNKLLFFGGIAVSSSLVLLLLFQFWSVFGAPLGYTFSTIDGARTDVNWYLGEFGSKMSLGRMVPLSIISALGPFWGTLWICLVTVIGTSLALRGIALTRGVKINWKTAALMDLLAFPVVFHMIVIGFYSQMLAGTFILIAFASRNIMIEILCLILAALSHPNGIWVSSFYVFQIVATWLANYLGKTRVLEKAAAAFGAIMILLNSYVWQALFNHLAYTIPKTVLFLAQNAWLKMKVRCSQISAWVLASLVLTFIDYNARTILFAYLLSIPFILESLNDGKIVPKKMRATWIALLFFEVVLSCMWTLIFYSQFL